MFVTEKALLEYFFVERITIIKLKKGLKISQLNYELGIIAI
jgi:hypothetical protein